MITSKLCRLVESIFELILEHRSNDRHDPDRLNETIQSLQDNGRAHSSCCSDLVSLDWIPSFLRFSFTMSRVAMCHGRARWNVAERDPSSTNPRAARKNTKRSEDRLEQTIGAASHAWELFFRRHTARFIVPYGVLSHTQPDELRGPMRATRMGCFFTEVWMRLLTGSGYDQFALAIDVLAMA